MGNALITGAVLIVMLLNLGRILWQYHKGEDEDIFSFISVVLLAAGVILKIWIGN